MGKPRMIIVVRHAQSEGNQNRNIHQTIPDHRVKLTSDGWTQAQEAGRRLKSMLRPDDTLQIYTSPYRRTRETTEGILQTLTSSDLTPSPFHRDSIKVYEEPRLREQDFGNFQPCSAAMERMWQERADYGHFFYRIPDGESAADAYDRISGFNETLWRSFSEPDFPSVCVLVTHGLMSRVFLMKWYHWSVEYFEDLRNVNHCEFIVMKKDPDSEKYILENTLRTWSELKRKAAVEKNEAVKADPTPTSPEIPFRRRWGGCPDGCIHEHEGYPIRTKRRNTGVAITPVPSTNLIEKFVGTDGISAASPVVAPADPVVAAADPGSSLLPTSFKASADPTSLRSSFDNNEEDVEAFPRVGPRGNSDKAQDVAFTMDNDNRQSDSRSEDDQPKVGSYTDNTNDPDNTAAAFGARLLATQHQNVRQVHSYIEGGRDFGGSFSGAATPVSSRPPSGDFGPSAQQVGLRRMSAYVSQFEHAHEQDDASWVEQSGMGSGVRADALGDHLEEEEDDEDEVGGAGKIDQAKSGGGAIIWTLNGESVIETMKKKEGSVRESVY